VAAIAADSSITRTTVVNLTHLVFIFSLLVERAEPLS